MTQKTRRLRQRPLLVGLIIDVSKSMQVNIKNKDGKKLPKIKEIQNGINRHLERMSNLSDALDGNTQLKPADVFCIGMGFISTMYFYGVNITHDKEIDIDDEMERRTQADVVCDLIALSNIVPDKKQFQYLQKELNKRWNGYAKDFLERAKITDDVEGELKDIVNRVMRETAFQRFSKSVYITLQNRLRDKKGFVSKSVNPHLSKYVQTRTENIIAVSRQSSEKYHDEIMRHVERVFHSNEENYKAFISSALNDFVSLQSQLILELLAVGHKVERTLDYFDESKANEIAISIYQYLDKEVRSSIKVAWAENRANLWVSSKLIGSRLNSKEIERITERCIQKQAWSKLEPFVKDTVSDLFASIFEAQAMEMIPKWVRLAAIREVIVPIGKAKGILSNEYEQDIFSDSFMFGVASIKEAVNRASLRLLDKKYRSRDKILIIISDGEFNTDIPEVGLSLLKQAGVSIISCLVTSKDIVKGIKAKPSDKWPDGAKSLFGISSGVRDDDSLTKRIRAVGLDLPDNSKLFLQLNQSEVLEKLLDAIFQGKEFSES